MKAKATSKSTKKTSTKSSSPIRVDNNSWVSIREIENGFIVSENGYTGKGRNQQYYDKQYYSPTNPVAGIGTKIKFGSKK